MSLCAVLAAALVCVACWMAWKVWANLPVRLYPHHFLCASLGLYYGLGTLVGLVRLQPADLQAALSREGAGVDGLLHALLLLLGLVLLLHLVCSALASLTSLPTAQIKRWLSSMANPDAFRLFSAVVVAVQLLLVATGKLGLSGIQVEEGSARISPVAALVQPFSLSLMMICGYGGLRNDHRVFRLVALLVQTALAILAGRRYAVVALALAGIGFLLARPSRVQIAALLLAAGAATAIAFPVFTALRSAGQGQRDKMALGSRVQEAWTILRTGTTPSGEGFWETFSENLESRPFIIGYLASLCSRPRHYVGTGGKVLMGALAGALPSALFSQKDRLVALGAEEFLAYKELGMTSIEDEAETPLTSAYVDGRELGVALSIPLFVIWLWFMRLLCLSAPVPAVSLAVLAATLFCVLFVEDGLVSWAVTVRNALLLWIAGVCLQSVRPILKAILGLEPGMADQPERP